MTDEAEVAREMERMAAHRARERAMAARWDLDVAALFFTILIVVIILVFQEVAVVFVALAAVCGLVMGWLMGWSKGRQKYQLFYYEELAKLKQEFEGGTVWEKLKEEVEKELEKETGER